MLSIVGFTFSHGCLFAVGPHLSELGLNGVQPLEVLQDQILLLLVILGLKEEASRETLSPTAI